jgi:hypothetical protein
MAPRVRGNLAYQERRETVLKTGNGKGVRWTLARWQLVVKANASFTRAWSVRGRGTPHGSTVRSEEPQARV